MAILICILVVVALVIFAGCLFRSLVSNEPVDKSHVPDSVSRRDEFEEMHGLEEQYVPEKHFKNGDLGGAAFDKTSTMRKLNMGDSTI